MSRKIFHIRDRFMKSFLSDPEMSIEFIRQFYAPEIVSILDFSTLEQSPSTFVSEHLKETRADIVFECETIENDGGSALYLCLVIEHKSIPSRYASVQTGGYIFDAYRRQIKEGKDPLNLVIPLLYYHGSDDWKPPPMKELFGIVPPSLADYIPSFKLLFENISQYTDDQIWQMGSSLFASALMVQKYSEQPGELNRRFGQIFSILNSLRGRNLVTSMLVFYIEMTESKQVSFDELLQQIPVEMKTKFISLADRFRNEGKEQGLEQGLEQGVEIGVEKEKEKVVVNMLREGADIEFICNVAEVSREYVLRIKERLQKDN